MVIESITEWRNLKRSLSRDEFVDQFPHPFLLRHRLAMTMSVPIRSTGDWSSELDYDTNVVDINSVPLVRAQRRLRQARIVRLVKTKDNPYQGRIIVGRARNCDVVLRSASVSKLHAYFVIHDESHAELCDMNSSNGSRVRDVRLEPGKPHPLVPGELVTFADVVGEFLNASLLYALL